MEDLDYEKKFNEMQKYIPFLERVIGKLKDNEQDKPRKAQLEKMQTLHTLLNNKQKKLKIETLLKCESVLKKLHAKIEKSDEENSTQTPLKTSTATTKISSDVPKNVQNTKSAPPATITKNKFVPNRNLIEIYTCPASPTQTGEEIFAPPVEIPTERRSSPIKIALGSQLEQSSSKKPIGETNKPQMTSSVSKNQNRPSDSYHRDTPRISRWSDNKERDRNTELSPSGSFHHRSWSSSGSASFSSINHRSHSQKRSDSKANYSSEEENWDEPEEEPTPKPKLDPKPTPALPSSTYNMYKDPKSSQHYRQNEKTSKHEPGHTLPQPPPGFPPLPDIHIGKDAFQKKLYHDTIYKYKKQESPPISFHPFMNPPPPEPRTQINPTGSNVFNRLGEKIDRSFENFRIEVKNDKMKAKSQKPVTHPLSFPIQPPLPPHLPNTTPPPPPPLLLMPHKPIGEVLKSPPLSADDIDDLLNESLDAAMSKKNKQPSNDSIKGYNSSSLDAVRKKLAKISKPTLPDPESPKREESGSEDPFYRRGQTPTKKLTPKVQNKVETHTNRDPFIKSPMSPVRNLTLPSPKSPTTAMDNVIERLALKYNPHKRRDSMSKEKNYQLQTNQQPLTLAMKDMSFEPKLDRLTNMYNQNSRRENIISPHRTSDPRVSKIIGQISPLVTSPIAVSPVPNILPTINHFDPRLRNTNLLNKDHIPLGQFCPPKSYHTPIPSLLDLQLDNPIPPASIQALPPKFNIPATNRIDPRKQKPCTIYADKFNPERNDKTERMKYLESKKNKPPEPKTYGEYRQSKCRQQLEEEKAKAEAIHAAAAIPATPSNQTLVPSTLDKIYRNADYGKEMGGSIHGFKIPKKPKPEVPKIDQQNDTSEIKADDSEEMPSKDEESSKETEENLIQKSDKDCSQKSNEDLLKNTDKDLVEKTHKGSGKKSNKNNVKKSSKDPFESIKNPEEPMKNTESDKEKQTEDEGVKGNTQETVDITKDSQFSNNESYASTESDKNEASEELNRSIENNLEIDESDDSPGPRQRRSRKSVSKKTATKEDIQPADTNNTRTQSTDEKTEDEHIQEEVKPRRIIKRRSTLIMKELQDIKQERSETPSPSLSRPRSAADIFSPTTDNSVVSTQNIISGKRRTRASINFNEKSTKKPQTPKAATLAVTPSPTVPPKTRGKPGPKPAAKKNVLATTKDKQLEKKPSEDGQICAVSSTTEGPHNEHSDLAVEIASPEEPSSSNSNPQTSPIDPDENRKKQEWLEGFLMSIVDPSTNKDRILDMLKSVLDENKLQQVKQILYSTEKDESKELATESKESPEQCKPRVTRTKKNELDRLNEDIRDMFICQGVVTATGRRMCTLAKETSKAKPVPQIKKRGPKTKQPPVPSPAIVPTKRRMRNAKVLISPLNLRELRSRTRKVGRPPKMPVLEPNTPIKLPGEHDGRIDKSDDEVENTPDSRNETESYIPIKKKPGPKSKRRPSVSSDSSDDDIDLVNLRNKIRCLDETIVKEKTPSDSKVHQKSDEDSIDENSFQVKNTKNKKQKKSLAKKQDNIQEMVEEAVEPKKKTNKKQDNSTANIAQESIKKDTTEIEIKSKEEDKEVNLITNIVKTEETDVKVKNAENKQNGNKAAIAIQFKNENETEAKQKENKSETQVDIEIKDSEMKESSTSEEQDESLKKDQSVVEEKNKTNESVEKETTTAIEKKPDHATEGIVPRNTNPEWHTMSDYASCCIICKEKARHIAPHYISAHEDSEVYTSRLPPAVLEDLKINKGNRPLYAIPKKPQAAYHYRCPFCDFQSTIPMRGWLEHFTIHTGEYAYKCSNCYKAGNGFTHLSDHMKKFCPDAKKLARGPINLRGQAILGFVCHLCNFIQMVRGGVIRHLKLHHGIEDASSIASIIEVKLIDIIGAPKMEDNKDNIPVCDLTSPSPTNISALAVPSVSPTIPNKSTNKSVTSVFPTIPKQSVNISIDTNMEVFIPRDLASPTSSVLTERLKSMEKDVLASDSSVSAISTCEDKPAEKKITIAEKLSQRFKTIEQQNVLEDATTEINGSNKTTEKDTDSVSLSVPTDVHTEETPSTSETSDLPNTTECEQTHLETSTTTATDLQTAIQVETTTATDLPTTTTDLQKETTELPTTTDLPSTSTDLPTTTTNNESIQPLNESAILVIDKQVNNKCLTDDDYRSDSNDAIISDEDDKWEDIEITETKSGSQKEKNKNKSIFQTLSRLYASIAPKKGPKKVKEKEKKKVETKQRLEVAIAENPMPVAATEDAVDPLLLTPSNSPAQIPNTVLSEFLPESPGDSLDILLSSNFNCLEGEGISFPHLDLNDLDASIFPLSEEQTNIQDAIAMATDFDHAKYDVLGNPLPPKPQPRAASILSSSIQKIGNFGFSLSGKSLKYYCMVKSCPFLFSDHPDGLQNHFLLEHSNLKWDGYCHTCEMQVNSGNCREMQHMLDVHSKPKLAEVSEKPRIKFRRLTGDILSTDKQQAETPPDIIHLAPSEVAELSLSKMLQSGPKAMIPPKAPPTLDMDIPLFKNVSKEFTITNVSEGVTDNDLLNLVLNQADSTPRGGAGGIQISQVISLNAGGKSVSPAPCSRQISGVVSTFERRNPPLPTEVALPIRENEKQLPKIAPKPNPILTQRTAPIPKNPPLQRARFYCCVSKCKFATNIRSAMNEHILVHIRTDNNRESLKCYVCNFTAQDTNHYFTHLKQVHSICELVPALCSSTKELTQKIQDILRTTTNRNQPNGDERQESQPEVVEIRENNFSERLKKTAEEIVADTGLAESDIWKCIFYPECQAPVTEKDFQAHVVTHTSIVATSFPSVSPGSSLHCPHCTVNYYRASVLKAHMKNHARHQYFCYICNCATFSNFHQAQKHFNDFHSPSGILQTCNLIPDEISDKPSFFVASESELTPMEVIQFGEKMIADWERKKAANKTHFKPNEQDLLPIQPIFNNQVFCSVCNYKTKVRTNMFRHLQLHKQDIDVGSVDPINPVPCLEKNEKHFDKMLNLACSSNTGISGKTTKEIVKIPLFVPDMKRFVCGHPGCKYLTITDQMLRSHFNALHASEKGYQCPHCQEDICKKNMCAERIVQHLKFHGNKIYQCSECEYFHYTKHVVERHVHEKHTTVPFVNLITYDRNESESKKTTQLVAGRNVTVAALPATECDSPEVPSISNTPSSSKFKWECALCKHQTATWNQMISHVNSSHNAKHQYHCVHCPFGAAHLSHIMDHIDSKHPTKTREAKYMFYKINETIQDKAADTRPLWSRNDPKRVRSIRGILMENEEDAERTKKSLSSAGVDSDDEDDDDVEIIQIIDPDSSKIPGGLACFHCSFKSVDMSSLTQHWKTKHWHEKNNEMVPNVPFFFRVRNVLKCPLCPQVGDHVTLKIHLSNTHGQRIFCAADPKLPYTCGHCPFVYPIKRLEVLTSHYLREHKPTDVRNLSSVLLKKLLALGECQVYMQCYFCAEICADKTAIIEHERERHKNSNFRYKQIKDEVIYRCKMCQYSSTNELATLRHMIDHYEGFSFCCFCKSPQSSFNSYMQHCYTTHPKALTNFKNIYSLKIISEFLGQMLLIFPNGLILTKRNLLHTQYGNIGKIYAMYEEICKKALEPPIPPLCMARLLAKKSMEGSTKPLLPPPHVPVTAKRIAKRRSTVAMGGSDGDLSNFLVPTGPQRSKKRKSSICEDSSEPTAPLFSTITSKFSNNESSTEPYKIAGSVSAPQGFSFYGRKPEPIDISKIYTHIAIGSKYAPVSVKKFSLLFRINAKVVVEKMDHRSYEAKKRPATISKPCPASKKKKFDKD